MVGAGGARGASGGAVMRLETERGVHLAGRGCGSRRSAGCMWRGGDATQHGARGACGGAVMPLETERTHMLWSQACGAAPATHRPNCELPQ